MPVMDCDTVVIGSGVGGLSAAVALARAGQRVLVLERHYLPGGWSHSFTLEGYTFSPGVHYVGELEQGANLRRFFEGLGLGPRLRFRELAPEGYDHILVGGERYDVPKGRDRHVERMKQRFPRLSGNLDRYFDTCRSLVTDLDRVASLLRTPAVVTVPFRAPTLTRWGFARLSSLLDGAGIDDPLARAFLSGRCGNHGLAPEDASLAAHAVMIAHYMEGAYYPCGGAKRIPAAFLRELRARGGEIHVRTRVKEILIERGRAVGVELEGGERISAGAVISNADAALTYETLVPAPYARRQKRRALRLRPSVSSISLFAAVDLDLRVLAGLLLRHREDARAGRPVLLLHALARPGAVPVRREHHQPRHRGRLLLGARGGARRARARGPDGGARAAGRIAGAGAERPFVRLDPGEDGIAGPELLVRRASSPCRSARHRSTVPRRWYARAGVGLSIASHPGDRRGASRASRARGHVAGVWVRQTHP